MPMKVAEMIRLLKADGWRPAYQRGSHQYFVIRPSREDHGRGKGLGNFEARDGRHPETGRAWQKGSLMSGYRVVLEGDDSSGYSAFSLDLPGVVAAAGATREECLEEMRSALAIHIESLRADGEEVPPPSDTPVSVVSIDPAAA
jgi:predicted RNase H-like HicB family nuclease